MLSILRGLLDHAVTDVRLYSLVTDLATDTGRRASSYPHMQNWKMPAMAGVAVGDEGFTLVEIDYRNAENDASRQGSRQTARLLPPAVPRTSTPPWRNRKYFGPVSLGADPSTRKHLRGMSKKITYGTAYGMGADRSHSEHRQPPPMKRAGLSRAKDPGLRASPKSSHRRSAARPRDQGILRALTGGTVAVPTDFVAWNYLCQGGVSEDAQTGHRRRRRVRYVTRIFVHGSP
ncbi:MAG: hypothetical protein IPK52_15960 [Chloroflexi bacterium]|nr:hypothetical protein [Chloroflexota bacterium]